MKKKVALVLLVVMTVILVTINGHKAENAAEQSKVNDNISLSDAQKEIKKKHEEYR